MMLLLKIRNLPPFYFVTFKYHHFFVIGGVVFIMLCQSAYLFAQDSAVVHMPALQELAAMDSISNEAFRISVETQQTLQRYRNIGTVIAFIIGLIIPLAGFFGYEKIKFWIRRMVERKMQGEVTEAVSDQLPGILTQFETKAEAHLLRTATVFALRHHGDFDAALSEYGWRGNITELRSESASMRRAVIECLYGAKKNRRENRAAAWEAIVELVKDDHSTEALALYLRIANRLRKYDDALRLIDEHMDVIKNDSSTALRASTILRAEKQLPQAIKILENVKTQNLNNDLGIAVAMNAVYRDLGEFDKVYDELMPMVNKLITDVSPTPPDGWNRLINTYIATCIDRKRPEDAVAAAEFMLRSSPGAVEAYTVGQLILCLPVSDERHEMLKRKFGEAIQHLIPGEATTRCQVVWAQINDDTESAIRILQKAILAAEREREKKPTTMGRDVYFHKAHLGRILRDSGRGKEAIEELISAVQYQYGGEAKYELSLAYASVGEGDDAARWLREAANELPKWAARARDHATFQGVREVHEELAKLARSSHHPPLEE